MTDTEKYEITFEPTRAVKYIQQGVVSMPMSVNFNDGGDGCDDEEDVTYDIVWTIDDFTGDDDLSKETKDMTDEEIRDELKGTLSREALEVLKDHQKRIIDMCRQSGVNSTELDEWERVINICGDILDEYNGVTKPKDTQKAFDRAMDILS